MVDTVYIHIIKISHGNTLYVFLQCACMAFLTILKSQGYSKSKPWMKVRSIVRMLLFSGSEAL